MRKIIFKKRNRQEVQSMSNELKFEFPARWEELTSEEAKNVVAGEGITYWLGYAAGKIAQLFS
jgi:hypothetical protein